VYGDMKSYDPGSFGRSLDELRKSFKISFKTADLRTRNVKITYFTILLTAEDDFFGALGQAVHQAVTKMRPKSHLYQ
jgi:hypothetical protein